MNEERYKLLMNSEEPLTPEEISIGWHFCSEFDGLLVGPGQHELLSCHCWPEDHPIYKTRPEEDPFQSEEYQKFVESMVPHCHCAERYRPCDGVLAGGVCDGIKDDKDSDLEEKDEPEDDL